MIRKKSLLAITFLLVVYYIVSPAFSVPVAPGIHLLKQNDGSQFKATFWGDEWVSGGETIEGYSILFNETTKNWVYAIPGIDGNLIPSSKVVGNDSPPGTIPKHLRPTQNALKEIQNFRVSQVLSVPVKAAPVTGTANIPVILINFKDTSTDYTPSYFNTLLFGEGTKSMKDYFEEVSYGTYTISSGPEGIAGWYIASQNHDYYGNNMGVPRAAALVKEAVQKADAAGYDFSSYDNNNDGYVDVVNVVHQGLGYETTLDPANIHSHQWFLSEAAGVGAYTTTSGKIVDRYVIQPETQANWLGIEEEMTIGVFAHEYAHALDLPDLYDYTDKSWGAGDWSLMGNGNYNQISISGDTPAHPDAWSKAKLGWMSPKQVSTSSITQIKEAEHNSEVYQLLDNPNGIDDWTELGTGKGEYFLVENRRKIGFDAALPGEGLLIWHIDESIGNNDNYLHKMVDLEEADGLNHLDTYGSNSGDAFDPWYNTVTGFTATSTPNSHFYNGSDSGIRVTNIGASASTMTANLVVPGGTIPMPTVISITPSSGPNTGSVSVTITGTSFANSATVKLTRTGSTDIIATGVTVGSPNMITCTFPLTGVPTGQYDVVVTNPDAKQGILTKGFSVGNGGTGIGAFRPGTAQWSLDMTGNFAWDSSDISLAWGQPGDIPLIGDWNGDGKQKIGIFRPGTAQWILDYNGNKIYDGPAVDKIASFGQAGFNPVVGDWDGTGKDKIGVEKDGIWAIDYNGNYQWDGTVSDRFAGFGQADDKPVIGDWDGTGTDKIGSHKDGFWSVDYNGNYVWEGPVTDRFAGFGQADDKPVIGDWDGTGTDKIGMEINGFWATDYNGNYVWDGAVTDRFAGFGSTGDTPVVGDWNNTGKTKIGSFNNGFWAIDYNGNYLWDGSVIDRFSGFGQNGDTPVVGKWS